MKVFFDSNVFLFHLSGESEEATSLIKMVEKGEIIGFVNDIVISEVTYGFIRAKTNLKKWELQKSISTMRIDLSPLKQLFSIFENLPLNFGGSVFELIEKYRLLPNDAQRRSDRCNLQVLWDKKNSNI